jgi:DNA topoisomerase-1
MKKRSKEQDGKKPLIIVESPTKAKTISKYMRGRAIVSSSDGHIVDLPKSRLAVDINNNFEPEYMPIKGKGKKINELKKAAKSASEVYLATDPDREGEAISWHLKQILSPYNPNIKRILLHEITEKAIKEALKNYKDVDIDKVYAQQARRVLDRLVGYYLSPLLWKKVKRGLSAGRVQSAALRLICEREKEIREFVPKEYWTLSLRVKYGNRELIAELSKIDGKKAKLESEEEVLKIIEEIKGKRLVASDVVEKIRKKKPQPPYTTSKLQQDALNKLGFSSQKTMFIAQQLYEGIDIKGEGPTGLITYMRTDSTRISEFAEEMAKKFILERFSEKYLPKEKRKYKNPKASQDAHEAIRPTDIRRTPDNKTIMQSLTKDQYKLYKLIWIRFLASQMADAEYKQKTITIDIGRYTFVITGERLIFDGFLALYDKNEIEKDIILPDIKKGDEFQLIEPIKKQHFTTPPPRYTEATLIKAMEESGIGRPSTYAPTISTLYKRFYIRREGRSIIPTELGELVNELLVANFPKVLSIDFTANMESELDLIAERKKRWNEMIKEFFFPFKEDVERAVVSIEDQRKKLISITEYKCPKCNNYMEKRIGRYGYFLVCPNCQHTQSYTYGPCPLCDGYVIQKMTKKGRTYYVCTNSPNCNFRTYYMPTSERCKSCGKTLFKKTKTKLICLNPQCPTYQKIEEVVDSSFVAIKNELNLNSDKQEK